MSVSRAQREIDAREFAEWMAYHNLEPFGLERGDLQAGIVACTIANVNRGKGSRAMRPADFMPKFGEYKRMQTDEDIEARLLAWVRMHNAQVATKH